MWYRRQGDYYLPCLTIPAETGGPIGIWGQRRLRFIRKERIALYTGLLLSGKLHSYLSDVNEQAQRQYLLLIRQMAKREGVTDMLKTQDQMLWVRRMHSIRSRALELVNHDLMET